MFETAVLAILQGIAEFLPISSSGHLVLGRRLLGLGEMGMRLDVFLHVGTLLAVFAFYLSSVRRIVANREWAYLAKVVLSAVPVGVVGLLFKDELEVAFVSTRATGVALVFTGLVLTATRFLPKGEDKVTFRGAFGMGLAQALAILPGVSRSGMTLAAARVAKIDAASAAEFSFLMSAPPIAGAAFLEIMQNTPDATVEVPWGLCVFGALLSGAVGFFALKVLVRSLKGRWFWLFGPYCLAIGAVVLLLG